MEFFSTIDTPSGNAPAAELARALAPAPTSARSSAATRAPSPAWPPPSAAVVSAPSAASSSSSVVPVFTADEIRLLQDPIPFSQYGDMHERALRYMRWRRDDAARQEPEIAPTVEMASDARLMRFLVAKAFDCPAAAEMYIGALRWRREAGIDELRAGLLAANAPFFTQGSSCLQALGVHARDDALMAVHPRTFTRPAPDGGHELLRDRHGNLLYIECPGLIVAAEVIALGAAEYTAAAHTSQELLQLILDELSRRAGRLVLVLRVVDMNEVRLVKLMQSRQEKEGERLVKEAGKPFADAYPTTTYKNFLINLPAAAGVAAPLIKAVVPARSAKKVVLLGSKFAEELHKEATPRMLPRMLGGELDDGEQWRRRKQK